MVFEPMTLRALLSRRMLYPCATTTALVVLVYGGLYGNVYVCVTHISKRVLARRLADIHHCSSGHDIVRTQLESPVPIRVYHCLCWIPQALKELRARHYLRNSCVRVTRFKIKLFRVFLKQKRQKRHWNEMRQVPWLFETRNKRVEKVTIVLLRLLPPFPSQITWLRRWKASSDQLDRRNESRPQT